MKKFAVWFALTAALFVLCPGPVSAQSRPVVALVPLDDRPVTYQLPVMLGAIAGIDVRTPPRATLGRYLTFGDPDAVARWLRSDDTQPAFAFVLSNDMLAYGGLIASRVPDTPAFLAYSRLRDVAALRVLRPQARFYAFGTVMRLAPTGVPAIGGAAGFFAAGADVDLLTQYANLPQPPVTADDVATAQHLREELGPVLDAYLATRRRDLDVDLFELQLTAEGSFDRIVLGQDDAGPQGLHLHDLAKLRAAVDAWGLNARASIEPGADELGMVLLSRAFAERAGAVPSVDVVYSRPDGGRDNDPLEFAPIDTTVADIIRACGARRVVASSDVTLFVRVTNTSDAQEQAFLAEIAQAVADGRIVAVADLTFLGNALPEQQALVDELLRTKLAGRIDAFASWNTTANTVGTAIPEAVTVLLAKRGHSYDPRAHAQFMLDRYIDDYAFHDFVRPAINDALAKAGVEDHTYLLPDVATSAASENRWLLWQRGLDLLAQIYPQYRDTGMTITLPWDRTFETQIDVGLQHR